MIHHPGFGPRCSWDDARVLFGPDSPATKFWEEKIAESVAEGTGGRGELVLQDEGQCMYLNIQLHKASHE